ncbi:MAG: GIY-YIG nuclease family protein [Sphingobacteriales bacterium]|nr:MAG: GIY-YIG nuclease family protein [Sphingobacteriales bacterium]
MKFAHHYFVYIVQCRDGFYYTGMTNDLVRRLHEHNMGLVVTCFTFKRRPVVLKYVEHYTEVTQAIQRETQLKGWSRAKKEALFIEDFDLLKELAKCSAEKGKG